MNIPKFRAWLKDVGLMKNVVSIHFEDKEVYFGEIEEIGDDPLFDLDEVILMQSTGLTDKNGIEIFCDDILQTNDGYNVRKHQVIWGGKDYPAFDLMPNMDGSCNNLSLAFSEGWDVEVIGNIHANADLLNDTN